MTQFPPLGTVVKREKPVSRGAKAKSAPSARPEREYEPFDEFAYFPEEAPSSDRVSAAQSGVPAGRKLFRSSATPGDDFAVLDREPSLSPVANEQLPLRGIVPKSEKQAFGARSSQTETISLISSDEESASPRLGGLSQAVTFQSFDDVEDEASVDNRAPGTKSASTATPPVRRRSQPMLSNPLDSDGDPIVDDSESDSFSPIQTPREEVSDEIVPATADDESDGDDDFDDKVDTARAASRAAKNAKAAAKNAAAKADGGVSRGRVQQQPSPAESPVAAAVPTSSVQAPPLSEAQLAWEAANAEFMAAQARAMAAQARAMAAAEAAGVLWAGVGSVQGGQPLAPPRRLSLLASQSPLFGAASAQICGETGAAYEVRVALRRAEEAQRVASLDAEVAGHHRMTLNSWILSHRKLLVATNLIWESGTTRTRDISQSKTRNSYISVGHGALRALGAGLAADAMTVVDTIAQLEHTTPLQFIRALLSGAPVAQWHDLLFAERKAGTVHQSLLFVARMLNWAVVCEQRRLGCMRSPEIDLCTAMLLELDTLTKNARRVQRVETAARRVQVNDRSATFGLLATTVQEVSSFRVKLDRLFNNFNYSTASIDDTRNMVMLAMIGAADIPAMRIGAALSRAGDASRLPVGRNPADLAVQRYGNGSLTLRASELQKGHVLAPFHLQPSAPQTARALNALLDAPDFVHGEPMVPRTDGTQVEERLLEAASQLGIDVPVVLHRVGTGRGNPHQMQRSSCRRFWVSMTMLCALWDIVKPLHMVAICYFQLHDPRTAIQDYFVFGGLYTLVGEPMRDLETAITDQYKAAVGVNHQSVVTPESHRKLLDAMWQARDQVVRTCQLLSRREQFECPKCGKTDQGSRLSHHLGTCLVRHANEHMHQRLHEQEMRVQLGGRRRKPSLVTASTLRLGGAPPRK